MRTLITSTRWATTTVHKQKPGGKSITGRFKETIMDYMEKASAVILVILHLLFAAIIGFMIYLVFDTHEGDYGNCTQVEDTSKYICDKLD